MSLGTLLAFFSYTPQFYIVCGALIESHVEIGVLDSYMARVFDILDMPAEPQVKRASAPPSLHRGCEISFERVSFSYEDERQGIGDMSFHIDRGEYVAFVGPSGSGKSTILDLLMGFYIPHYGHILMDGVESRDIPLEDLRRTVALVSQDVHVWNASIRDNLCYANDGISEERIREAVEAAQLADFVEALPARLDTVIGERGVRLSGGERQRLSIARALLRDPRVLLLDEVTAALDALTERALQEGVHSFLQGRTVVAVAHRLSTIRDCDRIIVIADGHIIQEGPHDLLVSRPGLYRDLYDAQYRERPAV
jgi:ABC-type multidrug transport system fused ATPase/permease subunit